MRQTMIRVILARGTFAHGPEDGCVQCVTSAGDLADALIRGLEAEIDDKIDEAIEAYGLGPEELSLDEQILALDGVLNPEDGS